MTILLHIMEMLHFFNDLQKKQKNFGRNAVNILKKKEITMDLDQQIQPLFLLLLPINLVILIKV
jgi:hypothetical protein